MTDKIIMVVSAALMLINEMLQLGYERAEVTAAVALIATIITTAIGQLRREAAADRIQEKELELQLRRVELELATGRTGGAPHTTQ
jgi:hypothetical protein